MPTPTSSSPLLSFVLLLNRLALGGYFVAAGCSKIFVLGLAAWYQKGYMPMIPAWLQNQHWFNQPYGHAVPFLEITVGALVVLGWFGRAASAVMALLLLSFTIALLSAKGASGGGPTPYIHTNWILLALALLLTVTGPGALSLDALWRGGKAGA